MALNNWEFWKKEEDRIKGVIVPNALDAYYAGAINGAAAMPEGLDVLISWEAVNRHAIGWLETYATDVLKGISATQQKVVKNIIQAWIKSGSPLDTLQDWLFQPGVVGPQKAQEIATTEITRIYAEGNQAAWWQSGVVAEKRWMTAVDEKVCPICGSFHGTTAPLDGAFNYKGMEVISPPAHPRCRCWLLPVVSDELVEEEYKRILAEPYNARPADKFSTLSRWKIRRALGSFPGAYQIRGKIVSV